MKHVILYGAFDRHNYGDLLFPMVMSKLIESWSENLSCHSVGLISSDLSQYGALPSLPIKSALRDFPDALVVVAGGDVISCNWESAVSYLFPNWLWKTYAQVKYRIISRDLSALFAKYFGLNSAMPFVLNESDLGKGRAQIFNAVGATGAVQLSEYRKEYIGAVLNDADSVSTRCEFSKEGLDCAGVAKVELVPDSAIIMSRVYSKEDIRRSSSQSTLDFIEQNRGEYLFFQISVAHSKSHIETLAKELSEISLKLGYCIAFVAIGKAAGHNDDLALEKIISLLDPQVTYIKYFEGGVFDTMNLIQNCACYAGTSLHGVITSMSFAVPHVGMLKRVRKQNNFMLSWDHAQMPRAVEPENLQQAIEAAIAVDRNELEENANKVIDSYLDWAQLNIRPLLLAN